MFREPCVQRDWAKNQRAPVELLFSGGESEGPSSGTGWNECLVIPARKRDCSACSRVCQENRTRLVWFFFPSATAWRRSNATCCSFSRPCSDCTRPLIHTYRTGLLELRFFEGTPYHAAFRPTRRIYLWICFSGNIVYIGKNRRYVCPPFLGDVNIAIGRSR